MERRVKYAKKMKAEVMATHTDPTPHQGPGAQEQEAALEAEYSALTAAMMIHFPEILSRIRHASAPLFLELSRGFFLPFCTVALAALARVRSVVRRLGRMGLARLQKMAMDEYLQFLPFSKQEFEQTMEAFCDEPAPPDNGDDKRQMEIQTLASLGINARKTTKSNEQASLAETNAKALAEPSDGRILPIDEDALDGKEKASLNQSATARVLDDDDIGEALVDSQMMDTNTVKSAPSARPKDATDPFDHNLELVKKLKTKNKKTKDTKKEKKNKKRKETSGSSSSQRKKKKKASKGDFFDELFD